MNEPTSTWRDDLGAALDVRDRGAPPIRRRTGREFLGMPIVDIAVGADPRRGERHGHARGVIAIGDRATGVIALGVHARGAVAIGVTALGGVAIGWLAVGAMAIGGIGLGFLALALIAIGAVAIGGLGVGIVAIGIAAVGVYAAGFAAAGEHLYTRAVHDAEVLRMLRAWVPGFAL
ncbi:MAG: hypothetical protein IT520_20655 [Burkholderiales bacterium]|nr:hypothetical protein [Burkholderiales bacterium]